MVDPLVNRPVYALLLASAEQDLAACQLLAVSAGIGLETPWSDFMPSKRLKSRSAVEARYGTIDPEGLDRTRALRAAEQVFAWACHETRTGRSV